MERWEVEFLNYLTPYVTEHKRSLMEDILHNRTRYVTMVLEHMIKPHNGSAAIRTAECMGLQSVHVVTKRKYKTNLGIVKGATKWLDVYPHHADSKIEASKEAIKHVKDLGYAIVVTSPHAGAYVPETLPIDRPIALWLGNEKEGSSEQAMAAADYTLKIPMYGFTESYNVSVSAALCGYTLLNRLRQQTAIYWQLSKPEIERLRIEWYEKIVRHASRVKPVLQKRYA